MYDNRRSFDVTFKHLTTSLSQVNVIEMSDIYQENAAPFKREILNLNI